MLAATLYVQRNPDRSSEDDIIRMYESDGMTDVHLVEYSTPETKKSSRFYMSRKVLLDYVSDILKSLRHDTVPFECVQVTTAIHPSVVYHVADLDDPEVRHIIEDTVYNAIRTPVERVKRTLSC